MRETVKERCCSRRGGRTFGFEAGWFSILERYVLEQEKVGPTVDRNIRSFDFERFVAIGESLPLLALWCWEEKVRP